MSPPAAQSPAIDPEAMARAATEAAEVMKMLANPARLLLLCEMVQGERSVGELEAALGASQSYVSGQLARLRAEGLVATSRDGRTIRYRLSDARLQPILAAIYDQFCPPAE
ncbi:ArsR/SmtB family transcription factor [Pseudoroseicyclus sp. H15]